VESIKLRIFALIFYTTSCKYCRCCYHCQCCF